jgi:hypothetical protein
MRSSVSAGVAVVVSSVMLGSSVRYVMHPVLPVESLKSLFARRLSPLHLNFQVSDLLAQPLHIVLRHHLRADLQVLYDVLQASD